jgi:hypothetical protein
MALLKDIKNDPACKALSDSLRLMAAPGAYGRIRCFVQGGRITGVRRIYTLAIADNEAMLIRDDVPLSELQERVITAAIVVALRVKAGELFIPIHKGQPGTDFEIEEHQAVYPPKTGPGNPSSSSPISSLQVQRTA